MSKVINREPVPCPNCPHTTVFNGVIEKIERARRDNEQRSEEIGDGDTEYAQILADSYHRKGVLDDSSDTSRIVIATQEVAQKLDAVEAEVRKQRAQEISRCAFGLMRCEDISE